MPYLSKKQAPVPNLPHASNLQDPGAFSPYPQGPGDNTYMLLQWYSRNLDSLDQNILPLPDTKTFPYLTKLKANAQICPTVLVYTQKGLSPNQIQLFESLTKIEKHSKLIVVAYEGIEESLHYDEILNFDRCRDILSAGDDKCSFANIIDLQRVLILSNKNVLESHVLGKTKLDIRGWRVVYVDFDIDAIPIVKWMVGRVIEHSTLPIDLKITKNEIQLKTENNVIVCHTKDNYFSSVLSSLSKRPLDKWSPEQVFQEMCQIYFQNRILKYVKQHLLAGTQEPDYHVNGGNLVIHIAAENATVNDSCQNGDKDFLDTFGITNVGTNFVEHDLSWKKNISEEIMGSTKQSTDFTH